ncbi:transcription initiation factor TFIID subunit 12 [Aplysia californica]|uniref:Transcription initiation factor TFIID subunit 12 n=1 Tax=Aplysia californica TaxID=6500 RepID=A0ABM0JTV9_APLCA|nr:transcription initiation factor TFIID subunit 12 [Aplysia californica]
MNSTPNGLPGTPSPSPSLVSSHTTTVLNNGPSSSPIAVTSSSSSIVARPTQPEQIIVPVGNMINSNKVSENSSTSRQTPSSASSQASASATLGSSATDSRGVLDRTRLRELVKEVDQLEQMDDDVEDVLLQVADDFIENVVSSSCQLAKHRRSNTLEAKDVQLYLERCWNMQIPGFGSEEIRPYKKSVTTEAHKQRMALIRKSLKKY